jgi:nitrate/nitrite transporter NarK
MVLRALCLAFMVASIPMMLAGVSKDSNGFMIAAVVCGLCGAGFGALAEASKT